MRWLSYIGISFLALGITAGSARAEVVCSGFIPVDVHSEGIIVGGTTTRIKAVAYTTPKIAGGTAENLSLIRNDFSAIKKAGFNAVRSYEPLAPAVLQVAEDEGLFIVQALVHLSDETNFDSEDELREVIERAKRIVIRDRCRPGVVLWSLWNDAPFNWGSSGGNVVERFSERTVHSFFSRLRDAVRSLDTSRPLTAANVLNAKHAEIGMDLLDVIGINVYIGIYDWPSQRYSPVLANETIARLKNISEKYKKPVWISETGISSIPGADQADIVIPQQLRLIEEAGFAGFTVFQWRDDYTKASNGAQVSLDIEANWGLLSVEGVAKLSFHEVAAVLRGSTTQPTRSILPLRDPWSELFDASPAFSRSRVLENFRFNEIKSLRAAYQVRSKGNCHAYITMHGEPGKQSGGLSLRYVPEDYGAWLIFGRTLAEPIPLGHNDSLVIDLGEYKGGRTNFTVILRLTDGRIMRTPPLLLRGRKPQSYRVKLSDLILNSGTEWQSASILEISFRLNDVANFEDVRIPVQLVIKGLHLADAS